ncbi:DUF72 domain-containing protein [Chitinophaga pendula]|uniref:DUF72 domain-containing protein n=1 Tax=Chitinophaga TaxID=79328 RepID=UPI000BAFCE00|nr:MULTISPECIES: DUF72 domain-containing protein [Chitinophaga]ASZ10434.1 hypothetical protein CK934_05300 [Chitinophaga sp. MD30]UCJ06597.1 DUF72 domain-containing protein [Chitinophaga pendula]
MKSWRTKVHISTSGWSYKDWKGLYYPDDVKPIDYLSFYAKEFDCTEINTSFYHLPKKQTVINWAEKVPAHFRFCPKLSRYITHYKKLRDSESSLRIFFDVFDLIQPKLGPVLIQLPAQVHFQEDIAAAFYQVLHEQYGSYRFAIEVRDKSWFAGNSLALMEKYNVGLVIAHSGKRFPYKEAVTAKHIYLRFHGPGKLYASSYTKQSLRAYAKKCCHWLQHGHEIWIFFNNDFYGYAIENARTLNTMIAEEMGKQ